MPDLDQFEEAERRQSSENDLFLLEEDDSMPKAEKPTRTAAPKAPYLREKERLEREKVEKAKKTRDQNNSRAVRAARRGERMQGVEAAPQQPVEPVPEAREAVPQANAADEARRMEAALQEQIARETDTQDERQTSPAVDSEMNDDAAIAAQLEAEIAAAHERASEAQQSSPDIDELGVQRELSRQFQAESAGSDEVQAPTRADPRLKELEAANQALRNAAEEANQERLDAVSGRMAETVRADDAIAANEQIAKQLNQSNFDRDFAIKQVKELAARQTLLERESDSTIALGKTNIEAVTRARNDADARANRLESDKQFLLRQRDEAVNSVGERDQQLAQEKARNEALAASLAEVKQAANIQIAELESRNAEQSKTVARADVSVTAEQANRQAAERELTKRDGELRASKESFAAEKAAREQAEAKAVDFDGKLKAANEAVVREKAGRETAEKEAASQKRLVDELSGEGDKAKAFETARRDAETKANDLEDKLRSATEDARREKDAREAVEKNIQELTATNEQLATQVKEATQARVQADERMKTMSARENSDSNFDLRKELEQEKSAREAAEAKLPTATERIAHLEDELKAARETPDADKPVPSIEKQEAGMEDSRVTAPAMEDEFGLSDIDAADFDAAVESGEANHKEPAPAKSKDDEFGLEDISAADFDAAVAAGNAKQKEAVNAAEPSRSPSVPASRVGSPALDPAHTVKGNTWYRAGKIYVPEAQYDKMLRNGVRVNKEDSKGQIQRVPLEANKSNREILLQAPNGDLHSPKAYEGAHGKAAFEARAKAEGLDPKIANKWAAKDQTRPETLVKMSNGNLVDGKSLEIAAGKAGLAGKFGEKNVFLENQTKTVKGGKDIITGTGNYRRADNAVARAWDTGNVVSINKRLEMARVSPQPGDRPARSATPTSDLRRDRSALNATTGTKSERAASPTHKIYRNNKVVASVPVNGKDSSNGNIKRLNNSQRAASPQPRQNNGNSRNHSGVNQPPAPGYQRPDQGGAHNRQTSPTTTINLTVNGAVGHGTATPNVAANAAPATKYTPKLDDRLRTRPTMGRA